MASGYGLGSKGSFPTFNLAALADPDDPAREAEADRFFQHFDPRLRGYFRGRTDRPDELDDLMGGLWKRAIIRIQALQSSGAAWSWLTTIGENLLKDRGRLQRSQMDALQRFHAKEQANEAERLEGDGLPEIMGDDALEAIPASVREAVRQRWSALPEGDRLFLQALTQQELTHEEAAKRFGLPSADASRSKYQRLKRRLRG